MLSELFKTDKRIAILNYVLYNESTNVTEISKKTKVSKGACFKVYEIFRNFSFNKKKRK